MVCRAEGSLTGPTFHSIAEQLTHGLHCLTSGGLLENPIRCEAGLRSICGAADSRGSRVGWSLRAG